MNRPKGQVPIEYIVILAALTAFGIYFANRFALKGSKESNINVMAETTTTKIAEDE